MFINRVNGVQAILSLYRCKWFPQYSTAASSVYTSNFMVEYLITSLGFSKEQALTSFTKVSHLKSTENSDFVVDFFKRSGFDQTQIKKLVYREPTILSCNVDKTLKPKIDALTAFGLCGSDLAHVLSACPDVLSRRSLNDHTIPTLGLLKSLFGDNKVLISALKKSSWLLAPSIKKRLPEVVSLLKSYEFSDDQIRRLALKKPRFFVFGAEMLRPVLIRVERFRIPRGTPMFAHGICAIASLSKENLELRIGVYKSFGFSDSNVLTLGRKNPYALTISVSKLKRCLKYFLEILGFKPEEIASFPYLLTFSLEKRVIPRYAIWKALSEMELLKNKSSLVTVLTVNEPDFFRKFVQPFEDQIPDLYKEYVRRVQSTLEAAK